MVGNDIVDLHLCESPAYHHVRYLNRVCTPVEACAVRDSTDPCRCLAMLWASKEAMYKLLAKDGTQRHFIPRQFEVGIAGIKVKHSETQVTVRYEGMEARAKLRATGRWVHAIATFPGRKLVRWAVQEMEQRFPNGQQAKAESEAVRKLALELLSKYGENDLYLEFMGRMPTLRQGLGRHSGMGISLSHHGAFAAVTLAWPLDKASPDLWYGGRLLQVSSRRKMCSTFTA